MTNEKLRYGASSWSEKAWAGVFYPPGLAPRDQLRHYATQFDTVEADVTYYRVPDRALVRGWAEKTPANFVLSAKFPRSIVHGGEAATPAGERVLVWEHVAADCEQFLGAMELLGPKCGPLVLQFPYFNRQAFTSAEPFLERLDAFLARLPANFRYGVEVRNKAWIGEPLLAILRRHRVAFVMVELPYMPHPAELAARFDLLTTDFAYARLIGDRKRIDSLTDTLNHVVLDQSATLERWAELVHGLLARAQRVYVYANNHFAGFAPDTIRDFARRVEARGGAGE
jgi:uncharacterized protein YecE (DUF72 family)